jgi:hypothetical protein
VQMRARKFGISESVHAAAREAQRSKINQYKRDARAKSSGRYLDAYLVDHEL